MESDFLKKLYQQQPQYSARVENHLQAIDSMGELIVVLQNILNATNKTLENDPDSYPNLYIIFLNAVEAAFLAYKGTMNAFSDTSEHAFYRSIKQELEELEELEQKISTTR